MPQSNTGLTTGPGIRQILLTSVDVADTQIAIWVNPPSGSPSHKRWGYVKVERQINSALAIDVVGGNLWVRGRFLYLPFQASNFIVTAFWVQSGIPWFVLSGNP